MALGIGVAREDFNGTIEKTLQYFRRDDYLERVRTVQRANSTQL